MQGRTGEQKHVRNFREENCKRKLYLENREGDGVIVLTWI
jgi:hypothetical protein